MQNLVKESEYKTASIRVLANHYSIMEGGLRGQSHIQPFMYGVNTIEAFALVLGSSWCDFEK